jgi:plasmid stability protein
VGQLVVRNIENAVKARLQRRAKRHGRSMEEEVRDILRSAVSGEKLRAGGSGQTAPGYLRKPDSTRM